MGAEAGRRAGGRGRGGGWGGGHGERVGGGEGRGASVCGGLGGARADSEEHSARSTLPPPRSPPSRTLANVGGGDGEGPGARTFALFPTPPLRPSAPLAPRENPRSVRFRPEGIGQPPLSPEADLGLLLYFIGWWLCVRVCVCVCVCERERERERTPDCPQLLSAGRLVFRVPSRPVARRSPSAPARPSKLDASAASGGQCLRVRVSRAGW